MAYEFKIGELDDGVVGMVTLTSLGIPAPKYEFGPYSGEIVLGDGLARGVGFPVTVWHWGYLTSTQRATLKTYGPGKSNIVYIRTIKDDGTYADYEAVIVWAASEERQATRVVDFNLSFRNMVEQ